MYIVVTPWQGLRCLRFIKSNCSVSLLLSVLLVLLKNSLTYTLIKIITLLLEKYAQTAYECKYSACIKLRCVVQ